MGKAIGITPEQRQEIATCYQSGKSLAQTAKQFNISSRSVRYTLELLEIATRSVAEGYSALWQDETYKEHQRLQKVGKPSGATGKTWKRKTKRVPRYGPESPNWKGCKTPLNTIIRTCAEYAIWRTRILERDKYTCVGCGKNYYNDKTVLLDVDHIKSLATIIHEYNLETLEQAVFCQELWDINNGRILCRDCHKTTDTYGGKNRPVEYKPRRKNERPKR